MNRPAEVSFLIVGMQKAGTTALRAYLATHPQLYLSERKELHFFDDEKQVDWSAPDYGLYHANFTEARTDQICGEATPVYSFWPNAMERIHAYNPKMKLIFILRDRVERAYSNWCMEVSRGAEELSFSEAVREGRERLASDKNLDRAARIYSYVERGFYAPQIAKAIKLFTAENLLLLDNSDLLTQPELILQKTYDFLNVACPAKMPQRHFKRPVEPVANLAPLTQTDRTFLTQIYRNDVRELKNLRDLYAI